MALGKFFARQVPVQFMRMVLPMAASLAALWLLGQHITVSVLQDLTLSLEQVPLHFILLGAALTWFSIWAAGRYDVVAHRHLGTNVPGQQAQVTGMVAISLAQTLGFGLFTGALVRWRMLPGLSLPDALRLSGFVCVSFLSALAVILAMACLVLPAPGYTTLPAIGVVMALPLLIWVMVRYPRLRLFGRNFRAPSLTAAGAILVWAALDVSTAAMALYLLIPGMDVTFASFLPVFLIALGAALLSGAPGGVGPFELMFLTLMPHVPTPELLAGIVLFRCLYYALPAVIALVACLRPFAATRTPHMGNAPPLTTAPRAEVGVIRQNDGMLFQNHSGALAVWPTGQCLVGLFDPLRGKVDDVIPILSKAARCQNRVPCLYKITARGALAARRRGWQVTRIADEAVLDTARFSIALPACRGLRRKLRHAEKAGITIRHANHLPLAEMAAIDRQWQGKRGSAFAGTMGHFCSEYLSRQQVFLAYQDDRLVAFVSFHTSRHEWCLDLMRSADNLPVGTNHALILQALCSAAKAGVPRLSLAAVPACPAPDHWAIAPMYGWITARIGNAGLRRFKSSFAPRWQPLYAAAPNRISQVLTLLDIARAVHRPEKRRPPTVHPHNQDENYEVAPRLAT